MKKYTVLPGQSLFDIAVSEYGNVSGITWLITDNGLNGPTDRIYEGQVLMIRPDTINVRTKAYLADHPVIATIGPEDQPEGIGFWRLDDYIIGGPVDPDPDPDPDPEPEPDPGLAFLTASSETFENGCVFTIVVNKTGVYSVTFTNLTTNTASTYSNYPFEAGQIAAFGYFNAATTYDIQILTIHTQITTA